MPRSRPNQCAHRKIYSSAGELLAMSIRLFTLRGVPDDEAEEIRALLTKNEIDYYETPTGKWWISAGAIWLKNENQLEKAHFLIEQYQKERAYKAKKEYQKLKSEGKAETILDRMKQNPIQFIVYIALLVLVVYLSTKPFIDIGK